jgi:hypothetical protein
MLQGDLFQRLSLDEALNRVLHVYVRGFVPFTKMAVLLVGLHTMLWVLIFPFILDATNVDPQEFDWGARASLESTCLRSVPTFC